MIEGTVKAGASGASKHGVANVCVSNGRDVVLSDLDGVFRLPEQPEDEFVYVTVPSGYVSEDRFFRRVSEGETYHFELREDLASARSTFSFVQITDIHMSVSGKRSSSDALRDDLAAVCADVSAEADFIVATGDLTNKGTKEEFDAFLSGIANCPLPIRTCIGNHDDNDPAAFGDNYADALGPAYYSFDFGAIHFVAYDGVGHEWRSPDHQETWVRADLDAQPIGTPVVMLIHFPWGDAFYDRFENDNIVATFSGHWHCARLFQSGSTTHFNTPTFCFGGIDQSPRAYRFCTVRDGVVTSEIRALDSTRFQGASFRPASDDRTPISLGAKPPTPVEDWVQFRGASDRAGRSSADPGPSFEPAWKASAGGGLHQGSSVLANGVLITGTQNEDCPDTAGLVAMDASDGSLLWHNSTFASIKLSPAVHEGQVFAVTVTGEVFNLNIKDGRPLWSYQLGDASERWVYSSPLVRDNSLYVGMSPHFVSLDQQTGSVNWIRKDFGTRDWIASYPSPAGYGEFLILAFHGQPVNLGVLEADTGKTVWLSDEEKTHRTNTTPVIGPDGTIYTVSGKSFVRAFDIQTGEVKWECALDKTRCAASPALSDNVLYVPTGDGTLTAMNAQSGQIAWTWEGDAGLGSFSPYVRGGKGAFSSPVVTDRFCFFGSADGHLYGLAVGSGEVAWSYDLGMPTLSSPILSGDGLWTGSCDGMIHAFRSPTQ
jgi:outer membrane protein assembly factor BamB